MPRTDHLKHLAVSETGFVFDPTSGATFTVNPTGLVVLQALREELPLDAVVARLCDRFEHASAEARDEVLDFVQSLRQHALLPADFKL
jgi:PqqD family protein of HPr-rel-A system